MGAASDLLTNYQHVIADLRLVTGDNGVFNVTVDGDLRLVTGENSVFDVTVDGDLIYSKAQTGRHAEPGEVLDLFADLMGSDVPRYGEE